MDLLYDPSILQTVYTARNAKDSMQVVDFTDYK